MRFLGAARSNNVTKLVKVDLAIIGHGAIVTAISWFLAPDGDPERLVI
jgi:hypothetical protein